MLTSGIRNNLFPKNNRIAAVILLCVYAYMCGTHLVEAAGTGINLPEYLLSCITDHYYLMYALLFYLIIDSAIRIRSTFEIAKIRYRSLGRYYGTLIISRLISLFILVTAHLLIPLFAGFTRLVPGTGYNITTMGDHFYSNYEVLYALADIIPSSVLATVLVTGFLYIGISFICIITLLVFEIFGRKGFAVCTAVILIDTFTGFVTGLDEGIFKYLFLNDYFIFHHGLAGNNLWSLPAYALIMAIAVYVLYKAAVKHNSNRSGERRKYTRNLYSHPVITGAFYVVYCGLAFTLSLNGSEAFTWQLLKGFSYTQFNVIELLFYIAPIMFSLFFVNMEWENEIKNRNLFALIRYGKREKWEKEKALSELRFIATNVLIVVAVSFISATVLTNNLDNTIRDLSAFYDLNIGKVIACGVLSILFRGMEWFLFYVIDKIVFKLSGNTIVSYLMTIAFIFIGFVLPAVNPIGKGSLYQLLEIGGKGISSFVIMVILEMLLIIILFSTNKHIKKERCFHGISN